MAGASRGAPVRRRVIAVGSLPRGDRIGTPEPRLWLGSRWWGLQHTPTGGVSVVSQLQKGGRS